MSLARKNKLTPTAVFAGMAALLVTVPANACYSVEFDNKSKQDIHTVWRALGCAGVEHWLSIVCEQQTIKAGESKSYNYKWGTTRPTITIYEKLDDEDHPVATVDYALSHGQFIVTTGSTAVHLESARSCSDSYTISFTEDERNYWFD